MMSIHAILGWLSLTLALVLTAPYWLRKLNAWTFKTKDKRFLNFIKLLRKPHKILGVLLALVALVHGYLSLGQQVKLHTGSLVYLSFFLTAVLGATFWKTKNKKVFLAHKAFSLLSILLFLLHLIEPWALGKWFGIW